MAEEFREDVLAFIRTTVKSVWSLELLLLLRRGAGRAWSADDLVREIRGSRAIARPPGRGLGHRLCRPPDDGGERDPDRAPGSTSAGLRRRFQNQEGRLRGSLVHHSSRLPHPQQPVPGLLPDCLSQHRLPACSTGLGAGGGGCAALRLHLEGGLANGPDGSLHLRHYHHGLSGGGLVLPSVRSADGLFLAFALAFWLLALNTAVAGLGGVSREEMSYVYLLRLAAFSLIIIAIVRKNMEAARRRGP